MKKIRHADIAREEKEERNSFWSGSLSDINMENGRKAPALQE